MAEVKCFEPVSSITILGTVGGLVGGFVLVNAYEEHLGRSKYLTAETQIHKLDAENQALSFSKAQLPNEPNGLHRPSVDFLATEIAERSEKIAAIEAQKPNYHSGDELLHTLEFSLGGAFLIGTLATVARHKLYQNRKVTPAK